ncbi:uncharacterized protein LOC134832493 [Culicoides brevitarsis]|uniref:uncharacterized protein LOC134832493 n=1 Tax=Culicoides brevitarsis TaxID=469753 RepID=UPI00307B8CC4
MGNSIKFMTITLLMLSSVVIRVQSADKMTNKVLDGKTFGLSRNFDIWSDKQEKGGFFEEQKNTKEVIRDDLLSISSQALSSSNMTSGRKSKVLNILASPNEDECISNDGLHTGVCLNVYECRLQGGKSKGDCALGFGVCCVFIATCDDEIRNNITYFMSPKFPALLPKDITSCALKIMPIHPDISQIRLDFVHFALGQPNRKTGVCDGDVMHFGGGVLEKFILCGQNTGQHVYLDVNPKSRDGGIIEVFMNFTSRSFNSRLWEIRVTQVPFSQRAPSGCLQYFTEPEGILQTFNFAENGRHLASQNYRACFRQNLGMCSIAYEPCNDQSFRIGPGISNSNGLNDAVGAGAAGNLPSAGGIQASIADEPAVLAGDLQALGSEDNPDILDQADPADNVIATDENDIEGSGGGEIAADTAGGGFLDTFREMFFSFRSMRSNKYGKMRAMSDARQLYSTCTDRITMPCIIEDFIGVGMGDVPTCVPVHCGSSLCPPGVSPCRLESSVTPFRLGIVFGDGAGKGSPEDNIGACLKFSQVAC